MTKAKSQGRRLIAMLKRRWMTYSEMLDTRISLSPQKRVIETLDKEREQVIKKKTATGLIAWRVIAATKVTA